MALYTDYETINSLTTVSFMAGSSYTIQFQVKDASGVIQDISTATMKWLLSPYGESSNNVLEKNATISGSSIFQIDILPEDTVGLNGVYIQQPRIVDFYGNVFIDKQGLVLILPNIPIN